MSVQMDSNYRRGDTGSRAGSLTAASQISSGVRKVDALDSQDAVRALAELDEEYAVDRNLDDVSKSWVYEIKLRRLMDINEKLHEELQLSKEINPAGAGLEIMRHAVEVPDKLIPTLWGMPDPRPHGSANLQVRTTPSGSKAGQPVQSPYQISYASSPMSPMYVEERTPQPQDSSGCCIVAWL